MEKQFVPYKLALELRNLGFNEGCFAMWQKNKKIWYCAKKEWLYNFKEFSNDEEQQFHLENYPKNVTLINEKYFFNSSSNFTAPLLQQAFDWFRERYNLYSEINLDSYREPYELKVVINKLDKTNMFIKDSWYPYQPPNGIPGFDNKEYNRAQLSSLEKLIEIVKQNYVE